MSRTGPGKGRSRIKKPQAKDPNEGARQGEVRKTVTVAGQRGIWGLV